MSTNEAEVKAKAEADAKAKAAADARSNDALLVEVKKDGKKLRVHPTCVKDHEKAGWVRQ